MTDMEIRDRILEKARDMFFKLGFSKVTMDEIAFELGMSKKTLYRYFKTKKNLYTKLSWGLQGLLVKKRVKL